jgi:hypothetical protein
MGSWPTGKGRSILLDEVQDRLVELVNADLREVTGTRRAPPWQVRRTLACSS